MMSDKKEYGDGLEALSTNELDKLKDELKRIHYIMIS